MLYSLYTYLREFDIPGIGLFQYLSFRSGVAFVLALLLIMLFGGPAICYLRRRQIGEEVRDLGLEGQMSKRGTPTMGGLLIVVASLLPTLFLADLTNSYVVIMLVSTVWLGLLGATDDYIKVFLRRKAGLNGWLKVSAQVALGVFVGLMLSFSPQIDLREPRLPSDNVRGEEVVLDAEAELARSAGRENNLKTTIPFFKNNEVDYRSLVPLEGRAGNVLAWLLFVGVVVLIVTAMSNGANLTDGLDGLAAGVSAPIAVVLGVFAYVSGNVIYSSYLHILYLPNVGELVVYMSSFIGALIGFLWYNSFPAKIFMGDTGSLTIGGVLGVFAVLVRKELLLPLLCGIFLMESLSVILQVGWFKYTRIRFGEGRRIFLMAPLHHHFQKKGMPEPRLVTRFWIVSMLLAVLTVVTLKVR